MKRNTTMHNTIYDSTTLFLIHRRMKHSSFNLLERLYPLKYEKADKQKLVYDGCEFGKHTKNSYVSLRSRSSHAFDLVHSHVGLAKKLVARSGSTRYWLAR
jgi:hypothetical protein